MNLHHLIIMIKIIQKKTNLNKKKNCINKNKNDNNTRSTLKKNIFKLKEILKIADNDKKQNHLKFNLKSLKSGIKK